MKYNNVKSHNKEYYYEGSGLAEIMKGIAVLLIIIGIIAGVIILNDSSIIGVCSIVVSILFGMLIYCQAETIEILSDIRENTEHLRDNINTVK